MLPKGLIPQSKLGIGTRFPKFHDNFACHGHGSDSLVHKAKKNGFPYSGQRQSQKIQQGGAKFSGLIIIV